MRSPHQQRIDEFMRNAGQELPLAPVVPNQDIRALRAGLILEEALETIDALGFCAEVTIKDDGSQTMTKPIFVPHDRGPNLKEIADGCADISVVTVGTLSACGIDDVELLEEVDRSNLSKFILPKCPHHPDTPMTHKGNGIYYCEVPVGEIDPGQFLGPCGLTTNGPYRSSEGKWKKGPQYSPANIQTVLDNQTRSPLRLPCSQPTSVGLETAQESIARITSGAPQQAMCPHCKNPLSDELIRRVVQEGLVTSCPQCVGTISKETINARD